MTTLLVVLLVLFLPRWRGLGVFSLARVSNRWLVHLVRDRKPRT